MKSLHSFLAKKQFNLYCTTFSCGKLITLKFHFSALGCGKRLLKFYVESAFVFLFSVLRMIERGKGVNVHMYYCMVDQETVPLGALFLTNRKLS